ncbi:hypothetical protein JCM3765_006834 [Sporobolomyces pararoseus]
MASITSFLLRCVGLNSTSKRSTPRLISTVVDNLSQSSIHDRSSYSAPSLKPPQLAFESPLFKNHPSRFVSLSELIPGLAPPSEVQLSDLESIEAEGEILNVESKRENELERRLCDSLAYSFQPTPSLDTPPPSQISIFLSSLFESKPPLKPFYLPFILNEKDIEFCEKYDLNEEEYFEWYYTLNCPKRDAKLASEPFLFNNGTNPYE